jgi:Na+-translocating ferredoxin:NAD+ oxidoreductase RnfD subunit
MNMKRFLLRTPKGSVLLVFLPLLVLGASAVGWSLALPHLLAAIAGACVTELAVARLDGRPLTAPTSALLSGAIVGFVLSPQTSLIVTTVVGLLATISKHVLAGRRGHVFNPAALALLASISLFATGQSWWGALPDLPWPFLVVLLAGGAWIVERLNKFPLVLTFTGVYFGLFTLVGLVDPLRVAEMFRPPFAQSALFLALFMLTDPPTSPSRYRDQVWIGALVAVVSWFAYLAGVGQAFLLVGLLVGNVGLACRRFGPALFTSARRRPMIESR